MLNEYKGASNMGTILLRFIFNPEIRDLIKKLDRLPLIKNIKIIDENLNSPSVPMPVLKHYIKEQSDELQKHIMLLKVRLTYLHYNQLHVESYLKRKFNFASKQYPLKEIILPVLYEELLSISPIRLKMLEDRYPEITPAILLEPSSSVIGADKKTEDIIHKQLMFNILQGN